MILNNNPLASCSSQWPNETEETELRNRLGLYQVFMRLYEHNPGLLEEIISLEDAGSRVLASVSVPYIQGIVLPQQVYLVTNLLRSKTQALVQPQQLWVIGRDSRQVSLPIQDRRLSRCHAAIRYIDGQFQLVDLDSSNGSYVNGEQVRQATPLHDGDRIRLGSLTFAFFICQYVQQLDELPPERVAQVNNTAFCAPVDQCQYQRPHPIGELESSSRPGSWPNRGELVSEETLLFSEQDFY